MVQEDLRRSQLTLKEQTRLFDKMTKIANELIKPALSVVDDENFIEEFDRVKNNKDELKAKIRDLYKNKLIRAIKAINSYCVKIFGVKNDGKKTDLKGVLSDASILDEFIKIEKSVRNNTERVTALYGEIISEMGEDGSREIVEDYKDQYIESDYDNYDYKIRPFLINDTFITKEFIQEYIEIRENLQAIFDAMNNLENVD